MKLNILHLGRMDYQEALELQQKIHILVREQIIDDTILLLEHPPVLTLGVRGDNQNIYLSREQLDELGVTVHRVNRGGDVTYHGPGQIVGYPIFNLTRHGRDIHDYIHKLQEVFIRLLAEEHGLLAHRENSKYTGVWVGNEKIVAIGVEIKQWTSMHGFAFNVNTDMSHFDWINPCGLNDRGVTSVEKLTGKKHDIGKLNKIIADIFCAVFEMDGNICTVESLIG